MEIWRSGPSGAKVTKSGWVANSSGSSLRFSAGHFSRAGNGLQVVGQAQVVLLDQFRVPQQARPQAPRQRGLADAFGPGEQQRLRQTLSCASICSSASVTCPIAPEILKHTRSRCSRLRARSHRCPARPSTSFHALRLARRQRVVGLVDLAVELERLVVHAGFAVRLGFIAGAGPRQAGFGVDVHQDGEVGLQAAAGDAVQRRSRCRRPSRGRSPGRPGTNR